MIGVYAFRNSLPLNGVTSMPFRPGCHRPFHRSACLCSLPLLSWVSLLFVWFLSFLLLLSPTYASACSHFNRRHSPTLRPVFIQLAHTVFLWKERDSNPRCPTLFRRLSEALIHFSAVIPVSPSTTQPSFRPCPVPCASPQVSSLFNPPHLQAPKFPLGQHPLNPHLRIAPPRLVHHTVRRSYPHALPR